MLHKAYAGRTVLITGHTGFKGSWLSKWLSRLGARVSGLALDIPTTPSHFERSCAGIFELDLRGDIQEFDAVYQAVDEVRPDYVFHLAAQSLVGKSYEDPRNTYMTNLIGSMNMLEAIRQAGRRCTVVMITSDKCYENMEWEWGYRETDRLGGVDPYSSSKAATELMISSYVRTFFSSKNSAIRIGIGRAGNVIGGGDWAKDRILPDAIRACMTGEELVLRNPNSTRPWQHVLEPLSGYLMLGETLNRTREFHGAAFNFGPQTLIRSQTVEDVIKEMARRWEGLTYSASGQVGSGKFESGLLRLNCDKAAEFLNWRPVLTLSETMDFVASWYKDYIESPDVDTGCTSLQIDRYSELAGNRKLAWSA